jgi:hypothetical protein
MERLDLKQLSGVERFISETILRKLRLYQIVCPIEIKKSSVF